jgi:hypothetical protein
MTIILTGGWKQNRFEQSRKTCGNRSSDHVSVTCLDESLSSVRISVLLLELIKISMSDGMPGLLVGVSC